MADRVIEEIKKKGGVMLLYIKLEYELPCKVRLLVANPEDLKVQYISLIRRVEDARFAVAVPLEYIRDGKVVLGPQLRGVLRTFPHEYPVVQNPAGLFEIPVKRLRKGEEAHFTQYFGTYSLLYRVTWAVPPSLDWFRTARLVVRLQNLPWGSGRVRVSFSSRKGSADNIRLKNWRVTRDSNERHVVPLTMLADLIHGGPLFIQLSHGSSFASDCIAESPVNFDELVAGTEHMLRISPPLDRSTARHLAKAATRVFASIDLGHHIFDVQDMVIDEVVDEDEDEEDDEEEEEEEEEVEVDDQKVEEDDEDEMLHVSGIVSDIRNKDIARDVMELQEVVHQQAVTISELKRAVEDLTNTVQNLTSYRQ